MEQIKERILRMIDHYARGNKAEFARMADEKPQTINSWCSRDDLGMGVINKIAARFPEINKNWLIIGEGDMFNPDSGVVERPAPEEKKKDKDSSSISNLIDIIKEQMKQNTIYQSQIDRLITLLESQINNVQRN